MSNTATPGTPAINSPALKRLYQLINNAGLKGVSDIHIHPMRGVWVLSSGRLFKDPNPASMSITEEEILEWIQASDSDPEIATEQLDRLGHTSVAFDTGKYRVRASFRHSTVGASVTFRLIPGEVPEANDVGVPDVIQNLMYKTAGLILIQGPTGSGKTTAIAGLVKKVNRELDKHIYTIEDPIEFIHEPIGNTVVTQREVGVHALDYPSALENALRSKPNIIVVGEMLNPATAKAALHAASTGHLVITTSHAGSVAEAISTFIGQFPADEQPLIRTRLATTLLAVMVQLLVPTTDGQKLVAAREVLINNHNFAELIRGDDQHMFWSSMESDPQSFSLEESLANLAEEGRISVQTALDTSRKTGEMRESLTRRRLL